MGLDCVELVMEVEETFNITIPNDRAAQMETAGDLYAYILDQTRHQVRTPAVCLTRATFFELRRHLTQYLPETGVIRPRAAICSTIPRHQRRVFWRQLEAEMELRFPRLARPSWLTLLACCLITILTLSKFACLMSAGFMTAAISAITVRIVSMRLAAKLTRPFACETKSPLTTYRDLVQHLVHLNDGKLSLRYSSWNLTEIWITLQTVLAE
jgi:hypothetical protein